MSKKSYKRRNTGVQQRMQLFYNSSILTLWMKSYYLILLLFHAKVVSIRFITSFSLYIKGIKFCWFWHPDNHITNSSQTRRLPIDELCEWSHDTTNKMTRVPSEDSDQPGHPPSLIRVFAVRMKKARALSYPLSAQRRLIRPCGCPGWSESSLGAHSFCWFCHEVAHVFMLCGTSEKAVFFWRSGSGTVLQVLVFQSKGHWFDPPLLQSFWQPSIKFAYLIH